MVGFYSFSGVATEISNVAAPENENAGCNQLMSVCDQSGNIINFVVSPDTYFADQEIVQVGDFVTGYYDGNAPVILIYPPQYPALIVVKYNPDQNVKVDYFNSRFLSSDGRLILNIVPSTRVMLKNGQPFMGNPANRNLIVFYGASTRSIPAQTTPTKIVVWCEGTW